MKEIDIKNCTFYYFDDLININDFDPKNVEADKTSYKDILFHYFGYKVSNGVKPVYSVFDKINGHIGDNKVRKYLRLIPANKILKIYYI